MPKPNMPAEKSDQGNTRLIQPVKSRVQRAAMAKQNGITVDAKPKEQHRRMNHHPVVLQQGIEVVAVFYKRKVIGVIILQPPAWESVPAGQIRCAAVQTGWNRSCCPNSVKPTSMVARQTCTNESTRHYRRFPLFFALHNNQAQHTMPDAPQQERAFLCFPDTA